MNKTPKSLRLQIGIFGRTNVGKSSFLNMVAGQDVAITSPLPGTTTDVVEKVMELLPIGPIFFLDTAGLDDASVLASRRIEKTNKIFDRSDVILLVTEADVWTEFEEKVCAEVRKRNTSLIIVVNKIDIKQPTDQFHARLQERCERIMLAASLDRSRRDDFLNPLKKHLIEVCPEDFIKPPPLLGDLIPAQALVVLIIPIDFEAPKGRIILPQVQAIRDTLDCNSVAMVVKESEYTMLLQNLKRLPDLVVCDSQVVDRMVAETPAGVKCTTFSILFSRLKGDLSEMTRGVSVIDRLQPGDRILIAESCSHHAVEDDIGRVKIPRWLKTYVGFDLTIDVCAGRDYPAELHKYKLIIQCGSCMLGRKETLSRIHRAKEAGVAITNYGLCISFVKKVLERVLSPFPAALDVYWGELANLRKEVAQ